MQHFEQIRSHVTAGDFRVTLQDPYMVCMELSLNGGKRKQEIYLSELQDDDGRNYLRVSTVVAPLASVDCRRALGFNWQSRVGYLSIGNLENGEYLQLCENRPYESLTAAELDRLILEIGGMGDRLEKALNSDADLL